MKRVLRFWWGNKLSTMSANRKKCYRSIVRNSGIKHLELITPDNYQQYQVTDHPIHPAFEYLSEVHKSDYLRAYIGYHYGGGWTDIKYIDHDWNCYFDLLEANPDRVGIGCREMIIRDGQYTFHADDYVHSWCIAMSHFIFRSHSAVFQRYLAAIDSRLDQIQDQLKQYPGHVHPMVCLDNHQHYTAFPDHLRDYKYPLRWMEISGYFFVAQMPDLGQIMYGMPEAHNFTTGHNHR